ncbi:CopG family antitoxin [Nitrospira sp. BLG_1]|uniref:CopG family antitoxin n=1 Tax=Nitrospira sp. BLG_1 TaxID=3395883 RepID=UPI0039BD9146
MTKRKVPRLKSDMRSETWPAEDLSDLDFSQFRPSRFEFEKKREQNETRVPQALLTAVKARAKAISYTRFIRETLERAIATPKQPGVQP